MSLHVCSMAVLRSRYKNSIGVRVRVRVRVLVRTWFRVLLRNRCPRWVVQKREILRFIFSGW